MKQMIDYTEEKIALARELGLQDCANTMATIKQEVDFLTKINFKPISETQLDKMVEKRVFRFMYHDEFKSCCYGTLAIGNVIAVFMGVMIGVCTTLKMGFQWGVGLELTTITLAFIAFVCCSFPKCNRSTKSLLTWADPLPRGALLAVKEAKDAGLMGFEIHYPKLEDRRVMTDPVICGYKKGISSRLMIHAWDDGKVHD